MSNFKFLGKDTDYWIELESHAEEMKVDRLIEENAKLRSKVSYYEYILGEVAKYRETMKWI